MPPDTSLTITAARPTTASDEFDLDNDDEVT